MIFLPPKKKMIVNHIMMLFFPSSPHLTGSKETRPTATLPGATKKDSDWPQSQSVHKPKENPYKLGPYDRYKWSYGTIINGGIVDSVFSRKVLDWIFKLPPVIFRACEKMAVHKHIQEPKLMK